MAHQITVRRKNGSVRMPSSISYRDPPEIGAEMEVEVDGRLIRGKVIAVTDMSTGVAMVEIDET